MKKVLILAFVICALALSLSSCDFLFATYYDDQGLEYTSNFDGTCYVSGYDEEKLKDHKDIVIPSISPKNHEVIGIGSEAFIDCPIISSVIIPDSVTFIDNAAFGGCGSLSSVVIPDSVTCIGDQAFSCCRGLTSVVIGSGVNSMGHNAFSFCEKLSSLEIKEGATVIGDCAFWGTNLSSVVIPDSVTTIGSSAFTACSNLASVVIGNGVTSIKAGAFVNCTAITDVYYVGSEEEWAAISISRENEYLANATIHYNYVPEE